MKKSKLWLQQGPFQLPNPSRPQFTHLKIVVIISTSSDCCAVSKALTQHWELRGKAQQVASTSLTSKHRSSSTFFKDPSKHASNLQCILDVSVPLGSSPSVYPLQISLSKKKKKFMWYSQNPHWWKSWGFAAKDAKSRQIDLFCI